MVQKEKEFEGLPKKIVRGAFDKRSLSKKKKNSSQKSAPRPPQMINGRPLTLFFRKTSWCDMIQVKLMYMKYSVSNFTRARKK